VKTSQRAGKSAAQNTRQSLGFFAGSFDPPTLGHQDIMERAAKLFDRLVVGIGQNSKKQPLLEHSLRLELVAELCRNLSNVSVVSYEGMTITAAQSFGATALVRGLRTQADFDFEQQIAWANRVLAPDLDSVLIITSQNYSHISSSLVREIFFAQGPYETMISPLVAKKLADKSLRGKR
jgi:pantetheine-phosphate adenylyltransferase